MAQKKKMRYRMDFEGREVVITAALMGVSFFLRVMYYFGFTRPETVGFGNLLLFFILPVVLEAAFMILLKSVRLNAPGLYGILGALYCALLILQSFQYGNLLRTILAVIAYVICGGVLLATVSGLLSKSLAAVLFFLTAAVRFFVFDFGYYIMELHLVSFMPEAAAVCVLIALAYLAHGLKNPRRS